MANLSQQKRQRMLDFLETIKKNNPNEDTRIAINEIENELTEKKYGLVWEKHEENVDVQMRSNVPVFTEVKDREILGVSDSNDFNFLLEGDNLHSLKLLEKTHKGKVDVIYIDPPYNRGKNDFRYDDLYIKKDDAFKHSMWLSFMSERLTIARRLLNVNGVIFISIDDNEQAPLKMLCDEVLGIDNFLGIIIQNKQNSKNDTTDIQKNHEYIIAYRKQCNYISDTKVKATVVNSHPVTKKVIQDGERYYYLNDSITTRGEGGTLSKRKNLGYTVYYNPETDEKVGVADYDIEKALISDDEADVYSTRNDLVSKGYVPVRPPRVRGHLGCWTWDINKFNNENDNIVVIKSSRGENYIVKKRTFVPKEDVYESNGKLFYDVYADSNVRSIIDFSTNDGSTELSNILGTSGEFDNPKNVEMIKYLISLYPSRNALVLDFFAGSGTTGQAVLELNRQDRGKRRFILCTDNQNNICEEVTYKRVNNRIKGYSFNGKKTSVIFNKQISLKDLSNLEVMEEILTDYDKKVSEAEQIYDEVIKDFSNGCLTITVAENATERISGIPANLKYYKTDFIPKTSYDQFYSVGENLEKHIKEMVQLEHGISLDNNEYILLLSDEDADELEKNEEKLANCKGIYISSSVFLTRKQQTKFSGVLQTKIPDYYFEEELREVGEL